ncbi:MAG: 50S ribosomal protein L6 [Patescibacteria group bacterium]|nr:50S ribosomal protein L6 [Patescibacteria group bacterium]
MSKIAKIPVTIKEGVTAVISNGTITVTGQKGSLSFAIPAGIEVKEEEGNLVISQKEKNKEETKALFGLVRSLVFNMVEGVSTGFNKNLELSGVGYRAQALGDTLTLSLGFSHPVIVKGEQGITFSVAENVITVSGIDKALVGNTAAKIRALRPPEPYKGKGIKYQGERIRRKVGKAAKAVGVK